MVEREGIDEFRDFIQDTENPEVIVIGDNRSQFDFDHMNKALRLLKKGARLVAMQSELLDTSMGDLELNVGSWVGLLERASGVQAVSIGKPSAFAFELALGSMGLEKNQVIVVGDRVSTDVAGAQAYGLRSVLVKTGEYDERDLDGGIRPDYVINTIRDLLPLFRRPEIGRYREQDKESQR
jgi:HAD superfamily hydrolase (TIGR01450 family)